MNIHQLCQVAGVTRSQVNVWIARGYFLPAERAAIGKVRAFSFYDAFRLGVFVRLIMGGVPHDVAARAIDQLDVKDDLALLVVWRTPTNVWLCKAMDVRSLIMGYVGASDVQSLTLVNLKCIEADMVAALTGPSRPVSDNG